MMNCWRFPCGIRPGCDGFPTSAARGKTWNPTKHGQVLLTCSESNKQTQNPEIMPGKASPWARGCAPALFLLGLEQGRAGSDSLPASELQRLLVFPLSHLGEEADKAGLGLGEVSEPLSVPARSCRDLQGHSRAGFGLSWVQTVMAPTRKISP